MMNGVTAGAGVEWFKCGWEVFRENALAWVVNTVVLFVLAMLAGFVPVIGQALLMVATPLLLSGIFRMAAGGQAVEVGGLFYAFQDASKRAPLVILGLVVFAVSVVLSLTLGLAVFGSIADSVVPGAEPDIERLSAALLTPVNLILLLVMIVIQLLVGFGFFFAVGLVTFRDEQPVAAFVTGVKASLSHIVPLVIFGLIYAFLAVIAAIPLGLGFLVLLPVTLIAGYCAYRDVLGGKLVA
jgi:uncharacterized membrane protein